MPVGKRVGCRREQRHRKRRWGPLTRSVILVVSSPGRQSGRTRSIQSAACWSPICTTSWICRPTHRAPARRLAEHLSISRASGNRGRRRGRVGNRGALPAPAGPPALPSSADRAPRRPGASIRWQCGTCDDAGLISKWEDSPFDLRRRTITVAEAPRRIIVFHEVAAALRDLQLIDPDGERLVFGIRAMATARSGTPPTTIWRNWWGRGGRSRSRVQPAPPTTARRRVRRPQRPQPPRAE